MSRALIPADAADRWRATLYTRVAAMIIDTDTRYHTAYYLHTIRY